MYHNSKSTITNENLMLRRLFLYFFPILTLNRRTDVNLTLYTFFLVSELFSSLLSSNPRLKASLPCAVLTNSGSRLHLSTTFTANEYFLTSLRAYPLGCQALRCGCLSFSLALWSIEFLGPSWLSLWTNVFVFARPWLLVPTQNIFLCSDLF